MRVCNVPGCPTPTEVDRCSIHRVQRERTRGTRQQRGYDRGHDELRSQWAPLVAQGTVLCWRCKTLIHPDQPWDLGHDDHDRSKYRGPEHQHCNRATNGR